MSAWSTIVSTILSAGTFTLYGSTPTIIILFKGSIRAKGTYIILEDDDEDVYSDNHGKILMKEKYGTLSIFAGNETNRDNLELDVRNILLTSGYSYEIMGEMPSTPQKNIFKYEMRIKILD